jgi:aryl-alcohol dehydrogenase-like predicted oxidoreductase
VTELGCTVAQLALAWIAVNPNTSSVVIGASSITQLTENLGALNVIAKLTPKVLEKIEEILDNKPEPVVRIFGTILD